MGLSPPSDVGLPGAQDDDDGPLPTVPRTGCYAGESPWGSAIHVLWGRAGLVRLAGREKYCHNRGWAFAHEYAGGALAGVREGDDGPSSRPPISGRLQGKAVGSAIRVLWGCDGSSALQAAEDQPVTARREPRVRCGCEPRCEKALSTTHGVMRAGKEGKGETTAHCRRAYSGARRSGRSRGRHLPRDGGCCAARPAGTPRGRP
jgi:hypothetical protein